MSSVRALGICVVIACTARIASAGGPSGCRRYDEARAALAKALPSAKPPMLLRCDRAAAGPVAAWAIAAVIDQAPHVALVGNDGELLADAPFDGVLSELAAADLDGDGVDEVLLETASGDGMHVTLHALRRDGRALVEVLATPLGYRDTETSCLGLWGLSQGSLVVLADPGTQPRVAKQCPADATYRLSGGTLVATSLGAGGTALAWLRHFRDNMCACGDATCTKRVSDDMSDWSLRASKRRKTPLRYTDAETRAATQIGDSMGKCMQVATGVAHLPEPTSPGASEALETMTHFKDEMCACKDTGCAQKVSDEMATWSQDQAKQHAKEPPKMSDDEIKRATDLGEAMGKCMQRAMTGP